MQLIRIGYNHDRNLKIWKFDCRALKKFQLGFSSKIKGLQLGSARNIHSSGSLELENSGSDSSLVS